MSAGFVVFTAGTVLGAAGIAVTARRAAIGHGGVPAVKEAAVTTVTLAVYAVVCIALHYDFAGQLLGCVLSLLPLILGRRWLVSAAAHFGSPDA
jgi:hypothetical protein